MKYSFFFIHMKCMGIGRKERNVFSFIFFVFHSLIIYVTTGTFFVDSHAQLLSIYEMCVIFIRTCGYHICLPHDAYDIIIIIIIIILL